MSYVAYVDEFSDPGTGGRGSRWFGWTALIADLSKVEPLLRCRSEVEEILGPRANAESWATRDWDSRDSIAAVQHLAGVSGWYWCALASDTPTATPQAARTIDDPTEHRYYTLQELLHRLSWHAKERGGTTEVYVDDPTPRMNEEELRRRYPQWGGRSPPPDVDALPAGGIHFAEPAQQPLLNLADLLSHAVWDAVNPDEKWKRTWPQAVNEARDHLWIGPPSDQSVTNYGFVMLPWGQRTLYASQLGFPQEWITHFGTRT